MELPKARDPMFGVMAEIFREIGDNEHHDGTGGEPHQAQARVRPERSDEAEASIDQKDHTR